MLSLTTPLVAKMQNLVDGKVRGIRFLANGGHNFNVSGRNGDFIMYLVMETILLLNFETATFRKVLVEEGHSTKLKNCFHVLFYTT